MQARLLAWPLLSRALGRLLEQPRLLQIAGMVVGVVMVVLALRPLIWPASVPVPPAAAPAAQPAATPQADAILGVVAAYNQASITAAVLGKVDIMESHLTPDGTAWAEVQAEYARRAARGETHDPAMTRWGVLRLAEDGDSATVETQEQWDDVTLVGGQVVSSRRGILTRNTYTLRYTAHLNRWQIAEVSSTTIMN